MSSGRVDSRMEREQEDITELILFSLFEKKGWLCNRVIWWYIRSGCCFCRMGLFLRIRLFALSILWTGDIVIIILKYIGYIHTSSSIFLFVLTQKTSNYYKEVQSETEFLKGQFNNNKD